jgi:hypothetical protein
MKIESLELPVETLEGYEAPSVSTLHAQSDGSVAVGLMFSNPCLFSVTHGSALRAEDMEIESELGKGTLGVVSGLRSTTSGDTAFAVLQEGFAPGFLKKLAGGDLRGKIGTDLLKTMLEQDGGMGASLRHSVVQIVEDEYRVRRYREPGVLMDAAHIGDFIFGLCGSSIWREPYLNTEKRETLRKDLSGNLNFHRDGAGNFWFQGQNGRLLRMGQTDIKAKPTTLKIPKWSEGALLEISAASPVDEWLYLVACDGKVLFRVRVNPVSGEEELQTVGEFATRVTGIAFQGAPESDMTVATPNEPGTDAETTVQPLPESLLVIALEGSTGAELRSGTVKPSEDPEMKSALPELKSLGIVPGATQLGNLSFADKVLWAGEGRVGLGVTGSRKPKVFRIEL